MYQKKPNNVVIMSGLSSALSTVTKEQTYSTYANGVDALFSMESLSQVNDYREATNILNTAQSSVTELSNALLDGFGGVISEQVGASDDVTKNNIELASAIFGAGYVKSLLGKDGSNYAKVEALLNQSSEAMAITGLALGIGKTKEAVTEELNKLRNLQFSDESRGNKIGGYVYEESEGFSIENFDRFDPNKDLTISMMLSALSVVEPAICRLTYPTYRLQPGQNTVTLQIDREYLIGNNYRSRGKTFRRDDTPLLEAYWNTDLFHDDRTSCIPVYDESVKDVFVDTTLFGVTTKTDEVGGEYQTSLLAFNRPVDYISISGARGEIKNRAQDRTDQLDPNFRLNTLGFEVKDSEGNIEAFNLDVSAYKSSLRQQAMQGAIRKFQIFFSEDIVLQKPVNAKTPIDGSGQPVYLTALENIYAQFKNIVLRVNANFPDIDLTEASCHPSASVSVIGLRRHDGEVAPINDPTVKALLEGLTFNVTGYAHDMRRTDTNFTNTGKELESRPERQVYPIGFAPRITVRGPMNASDLEHAKLLDKGLSQITREKIVAKLESKFERLYLATDGGQGVVKDMSEFQSEAFGNIVTNPTLRYHKYKPEFTKTLNHASRMADVRGHVVNALRTQLAFAVDESRLRVVGKDLNKGSESIKIGMICDPKINQLLMVDGDNRLLTAAFDNFEIIEETAPFFANRIVCVFHVDTPYELSPVSNGFRAVGLSPVVKIDPDQSNSAKVQRIMTEPREGIFDTNDIMVVFEIEDLDKITDVNAEVLNVIKQ